MLRKKLLVVVDYQRDFVDGALGFDGAKALEMPIYNKIREYISTGNDVVFTMDTHEQKYLLTQEGKKLPIKHCIKGTSGWELYGKVDRIADGLTKIEKPSFGSLELAEYISRGEYSLIELVGVVSNICVISNAVIAKAASPESEIFVNAKLVASNDESLHSKALDILENLHVTVTGRE